MSSFDLGDSMEECPRWVVQRWKFWSFPRILSTAWWVVILGRIRFVRRTKLGASQTRKGENQLSEITDMSPGGELEIVRRERPNRGAPDSRAPGGEGLSARRYLRRDEFFRRYAPGGTRHPPHGLGAGNAWRHVSPAKRIVLL
ncbi:hypothetical protein DEO72_LG9g1217 [Vigna unguiculata]|uniref:Uncharacterized protein n=1 Tax=Vigna unguiculata TaxID=3917 RepID=A0A4D6MXP3_VIGUN|nr:hypothetical protein DEO72_LG9g1217 [Vigna unguiculata]